MNRSNRWKAVMIECTQTCNTHWIDGIQIKTGLFCMQHWIEFNGSQLRLDSTWLGSTGLDSFTQWMNRLNSLLGHQRQTYDWIPLHVETNYDWTRHRRVKIDWESCSLSVIEHPLQQRCRTYSARSPPPKQLINLRVRHRTEEKTTTLQAPLHRAATQTEIF